MLCAVRPSGQSRAQKPSQSSSRKQVPLRDDTCDPFTPRRIQQIVQSYRLRAGLTQPVHPHLFRHQMLTFLTAQGLSDAQLQLISGHASKKSLEVYQHLSLEVVEDAYQAAVRSLEI